MKRGVSQGHRFPEGMPRDLPKTSEMTHFERERKSRFGAETSFPEGQVAIVLQLTAIGQIFVRSAPGPSPVELGIKQAQTDAPLSATRSLSWRISPDRLKFAEPVRKRR